MQAAAKNELDPDDQGGQNRSTMTMGEIRASVTLENTSDRDRVYDGHGRAAEVRRTTVDGIVDTGAVDLVIPVSGPDSR